MRILIVPLFALLASVIPTAAQAASPYPGFSCKVLAGRQPLPGSSTTDLRVVKLTFAPGTKGALHRHKYGEILYLLSGNGTNTIKGGGTTTLSRDHAIVIPANTYHSNTPVGAAPLVLLSVQFPARGGVSFDPAPKGPDQCK